MRIPIYFIFTLPLLWFCNPLSAQVVLVPYTFTAGSPAKAAEVNANFQALTNAIIGDAQASIIELERLRSRVSKLEGQIVASDLAGRYTINQFQTELGGGLLSRVAVYTGGGYVQLFGNGTGTINGNTELGFQLNLPLTQTTGGYLGAISRANPQFAFDWTLSDASTITAMNGTFSIVAGGRLLIRTSTNPADGTSVILLLTRTN